VDMLEVRASVDEREGQVSETPQEILDRAAPIWDKHVVSFTLVLAALRATLAERDALRAEVGRLERARLRSADWVTLDKAEAERDALRAEALRFYHADGTVEVLASTADVIERRKAAAVEIDALRAEVERERRERISAESGCETQAAARYAARLARIAAEAERDALRTRVEAVLALHRHSGLGVGERRICQDCGQVLPCPTRRALEGEK